MKKYLLIGYIVLTMSILITAAAWFTWGNSCSYIYELPEGASYSGMCVGDGVQFVGIFVVCLALSIIYLAVSYTLMRSLGYKLTKNSSRPKS